MAAMNDNMWDKVTRLAQMGSFSSEESIWGFKVSGPVYAMMCPDLTRSMLTQ